MISIVDGAFHGIFPLQLGLELVFPVFFAGACSRAPVGWSSSICPI